MGHRNLNIQSSWWVPVPATTDSDPVAQFPRSTTLATVEGDGFQGVLCNDRRSNVLLIHFVVQVNEVSERNVNEAVLGPILLIFQTLSLNFVPYSHSHSHSHSHVT
jgi:hypothetical protein